ncbi:MAG: hypothetical protein ACLVGQ_07470 [Blautia massiliensis (ex Durand et al. 2017)]|uniref:hypothetical protein n=1 Tax=Blautia massiliensis (ex Durand et al. 2017) TaxID=1737424 RepID=UPI00399D0DC3
MDVQKLMLFYVPIYGAILYKYHGWGYKGLIRAILWLIAPVILVYSLPAPQDSLCDAGNYADYVDDRNQRTGLQSERKELSVEYGLCF